MVPWDSVAMVDWPLMTEGEEATKSPLRRPSSLTFNAEGELFVVTDVFGVYYVLKIGTDGRLRKIAGNGVVSFSGDGGPAVDASLGDYISIALGKDGEMYIADTYNYRIKMINSTIISTIAGNGQYGQAGDGGPAIEASFTVPYCVNVAPNGDIYVGDDTRSA